MNRRTIKLAARESAVLQELCKNMNMVVESSQLLMRHWGNDNFFSLRSLNVYITRLRNHFKDEPAVKIISIRGVGYRLEVQI
jgi:DNA-binding response OmpR family regulator